MIAALSPSQLGNKGDHRIVFYDFPMIAHVVHLPRAFLERLENFGNILLIRWKSRLQELESSFSKRLNKSHSMAQSSGKHLPSLEYSCQRDKSLQAKHRLANFKDHDIIMRLERGPRSGHVKVNRGEQHGEGLHGRTKVVDERLFLQSWMTLQRSSLFLCLNELLHEIRRNVLHNVQRGGC